MIARLRVNVETALAQYDTIGNAVFGKPRHFTLGGIALPKYPAANMKAALLKVIEDTSGVKRAAEISLKNEHKFACRT